MGTIKLKTKEIKERLEKIIRLNWKLGEINSNLEDKDPMAYMEFYISHEDDVWSETYNQYLSGRRFVVVNLDLTKIIQHNGFAKNVVDGFAYCVGVLNDDLRKEELFGEYDYEYEIVSKSDSIHPRVLEEKSVVFMKRLIEEYEDIIARLKNNELHARDEVVRERLDFTTIETLRSWNGWARNLTEKEKINLEEIKANAKESADRRQEEIFKKSKEEQESKQKDDKKYVEDQLLEILKNYKIERSDLDEDFVKQIKLGKDSWEGKFDFKIAEAEYNYCYSNEDEEWNLTHLCGEEKYEELDFEGFIDDVYDIK